MYKQRIILFFSTLLFIFFLSFAATFLFIKYPLYTPADYWAKTAIEIKEHNSNLITAPKMIIASGSNSLMGICTPLLKEKINIETVNFGLSSFLPVEVFFSLVKKNAKPDDIVLMPLEYSYYTNNNKFNETHVGNLTTWGTEFIWEYSASEIIALMIQSFPSYCSRIIKYHTFTLPSCSYDEYMQRINASSLLSKKLDMDKSINSFGDLLQDSASLLKKDFKKDCLNVRLLQDSRFKQLKDFSDELAKNNITLILTYPVTIQNPEFDLTNKEHLNRIQQLNNKFEKYHLKYTGIPILSNFEFEYSFNTVNHLNAEGAILHTLYLADTLNAYFSHTKQQIDDLSEYKRQKKAEAKTILEEYRKLGYLSK